MLALAAAGPPPQHLIWMDSRTKQLRQGLAINSEQPLVIAVPAVVWAAIPTAVCLNTAPKHIPQDGGCSHAFLLLAQRSE